MRAALLRGVCCLFFSAVAAGQGAASAPAALLAIPDAADQARAQTMIHTIFKDDFARTAPESRAALARRLIAEAAGTRDDPAARYVLLADAADLAASAGDGQTAIDATGELARLYAVDGLGMCKGALLRASGAIDTPEAAEALARLCLDTADAAALADAFDTVQQLANVAEGAANKTRKVAFVAGIQVHLADLRSLIGEFAQAQQALAALKDRPDDAAAHLVVGRFYALHKGQWEAGLPHLAAGADPVLRALAAKELAAPTDGLDQTALGDAWWDFAEKTTGLTQGCTRRRALFWYQRAQASLQGVTLTRIEARLRTGMAVAGVAPPAGSAASGATAVNLLALIDPQKDAGDGKWSLENGGLLAASGKYAVLQLPYLMPEEYDLRVSFTRLEGEGPIDLLLVAHKRAFGLAIDVKGEARFERVGNKIAQDNPTTVPIAISNGRQYTVTVQIRRDTIRALLADKLITEWKTDYKDLSRYALWKLPDDKLCGLGANNAKVIFHRVEVIEVTGKGKPLR